MSDTTRKDNELRMEIIRKTSTRMSLSDVDIVMQIIRQYGIQERGEADLLARHDEWQKIHEHTQTPPIKNYGKPLRGWYQVDWEYVASRTDDLFQRVAELTDLKDKETK